MDEYLLAGYEGVIHDIHVIIGADKEFFVRTEQYLRSNNLTIVEIIRNEDWLKFGGIRRYEIVVKDEDGIVFLWKAVEDMPAVITYKKPTAADRKEREELDKD